MTRWARSGNTQKHKKMPGSGTSWQEFSSTPKIESASKDRKINKIQRDRIEKKKRLVNKKVNRQFHSYSSDMNEFKDLLIIAASNHKFCNVEIPVDTPEYEESNHDSVKDATKDKYQNKMDEKNKSDSLSGITNDSTNPLKPSSEVLFENNESSDKMQKQPTDEAKTQIDNLSILPDNKIIKSSKSTREKLMTKTQWRKEKKLRKLQELAAMQAEDTKSIPLDEFKDTSSDKSEEVVPKSQTDEEKTASPSKRALSKNKFFEECQKKRRLNGITLLPNKVEHKIYNLKKYLRQKGMPGEKIKEIVRKERRQEELKFRKAGDKSCFNCRKIGHFLSDCPLKLGDLKQATGICFKCGSSEHVSFKCPKNIKGYPLAKCFVCKEQGHISKNCPKNDRGIYIKGDKCYQCGNLDHLSKDCPSKRKDKEYDMTVDTIHEGVSVDAEFTENNLTDNSKKKTFNKRKVVKF